ncbi:MAG: Type 1 glutamine amidotransferase-like domain-containing protein, partial [Bifidobacteriaceae bacterium]|nr:Type 1 glutamine amidotransferase-like domain-containing protein [Bifidobacteriaceae bacterium]
YGIDNLLKQSALEGKPITGVSAGAIAPMVWGHSDSMSYRTPAEQDWEYIKVSGLGILPFCITPHYDTKMPPKNRSRSKEFKKMFFETYNDKTPNNSKTLLTGYGINNFAAILAYSGKLEFVNTREKAHIHKLFLRGGQTATETIFPKTI